MPKAAMPIRAIAPWFGSGRLIAERVGLELQGLKWVGVPFAGGMSELAEIGARTIVVNDLHRHVINLARCIGEGRPELFRRLRDLPFHPEVLTAAQKWCRDFEPVQESPDIYAAINYFVCCWMGRSHKAGAEDEFTGGLSKRWNATGGDSNVRFRSAIRGLAQWRTIMRRCSFFVMDAFEFLASVHDDPDHGLYVDAPWPDDGAGYRHKFAEQQQRDLAARLAAFKSLRVVIRYGDHPLIRELYQPPFWKCYRMAGRNQMNDRKAELLIINGDSNVADNLFS